METQSSILFDLAQGTLTKGETAYKEKYRKAVQTPTNPYLTTSARNLLQRLYDLRGKRILTGQHDYLEAPEWLSGEIWKKTGFDPFIKGVEFGGITNQNETTLASQRQGVVNSCKTWHNKNGYVTATYHASYPGMAQDWPNVQRSTTQAEFDQIVTPGTALYNALITDIDKVAGYLKQLRDAGIPVLWRPYHEMNGGWFWWGAKTNFTELWNIMYDRYTNTHQLHNLIWVWCPNAKNNWCEEPRKYYVGHDKTDVVALDIYSNDFKQSHHDDLLAIGEGKIMAIGENGEIPNLSTMSSTQNQYSWFLTWGKMLLENNNDTTIKNTYVHPYAFRRGDKNPSVVGDGLLGQYYSGINFDTLKETRIDPSINFMWNQTAPAVGMPVDNFTVRWTGFVQPLYSEEYTFTTKTDDGARLWVNDVLLVDKFQKQSFGEWSGKITLEAGKLYSIKMEFLEIGGDARALLYWSSASTPKQIIPQTQLYSK